MKIGKLPDSLLFMELAKSSSEKPVYLDYPTNI